MSSPAVGMKSSHPTGGLAVPDGHVGGLADQVGASMIRQRIHGRLLRTAVQDGGQVHEPRPSRNVGYVPTPLDTRGGRGGSRGAPGRGARPGPRLARWCGPFGAAVLLSPDS